MKINVRREPCNRLDENRTTKPQPILADRSESGRIEGLVSAEGLLPRELIAQSSAKPRALHDAGRPVDLLTVADALEARGESLNGQRHRLLETWARVGSSPATRGPTPGRFPGGPSCGALRRAAPTCTTCALLPAGLGEHRRGRLGYALQALVDHTDTEPSRLRDVLLAMCARRRARGE